MNFANVPCWCNSGKKWKKCHFPTSQLPDLRPDEIDHLLREKINKRCLAKEYGLQDCSKIIGAHSLSKENWLRAITEVGHVYTIKGELQQLLKNHGKYIPYKIGINNASVFSGFCGTHDNDLFKAIDTSAFDGSEQQLKELWLRLVSREKYWKDIGIKIISNVEYLYRNSGYLDQKAVYDEISEMIRRSIESMKIIDDQMALCRSVVRDDKIQIDHEVIEVPINAKVIYCGCKNVAVSAATMSNDGALVGFCFIPDGIISKLIIIWPSTSDITDYIRKLRESIRKYGSRYLVGFGLGSFEEIYMRISWFDALSQPQKDAVITICNSAASGKEWDVPDLLEALPDFVL